MKTVKKTRRFAPKTRKKNFKKIGASRRKPYKKPVKKTGRFAAIKNRKKTFKTVKKTSPLRGEVYK